MHSAKTCAALLGEFVEGFFLILRPAIPFDSGPRRLIGRKFVPQLAVEGFSKMVLLPAL
jgi:hypothetical protein